MRSEIYSNVVVKSNYSFIKSEFLYADEQLVRFHNLSNGQEFFSIS